ncbi:MAG TPA: AI-2E family transporter [Rubrobacter sp.]|nr:AI-2E family transporter [Rubrobacter sp.]
MTPDTLRGDGPPEEIVGARDMGHKETQAKPGTDAPTKPQTAPLAESNGSVPSGAFVWVRITPSQVMSTVVIALLTAAVVLGAFFLLWKVRTFVGWFVIALFLAAVLDPVVNWLQRRHRLIKRSLAIVLTYLGLVVALLFMVGLLLPILVDQINSLINFVAAVAEAPEGPTEYIKGLAQQYGFGWVFERFSHQIEDIRSQVGVAARNFLLSTRDIVVSGAGFVAALVTVLTLTFFLILGKERYLDAGVGLFAERHRPLVRRILEQSAGAVTGYVGGNLAISAICGVVTFIVLVVLGMPYAIALALLVAVLDLIPLVGATLGGALLVIVGLFVAPWKAVVLVIFIVVYQQVEGSILQPMVYSHAVQLNALVIFIAVLVGGMLLGIPGALLAIPVAQIIRIVVTEVVAYRRTIQEANKPTVASPSQPIT